MVKSSEPSPTARHSTELSPTETLCPCFAV